MVDLDLRVIGGVAFTHDLGVNGVILHPRARENLRAGFGPAAFEQIESGDLV